MHSHQEINKDKVGGESLATIRRLTWWGVFANVGLSLLKFVFGVFSGSLALVADAAHSLLDLVSDFAVLIFAKAWHEPPDEKHPYGHAKIEAMVSLFIAVLVAGVGVGIGYNGFQDIISGGGIPVPGPFALLTAILSVVVKEILYKITVKEADRIGSEALRANAWHHRSDAIGSIPVAVALAISVMIPGLSFLDRMEAFVVAGFILQVGWNIARPALDVLLDRGASDELTDIMERIAKSVKGVRSVHGIRSRKVGSGYYMDLHVQVNPEMNVRDAHSISGEVKNALKESDHRIFDVLVHIEPDEE